MLFHIECLFGDLSPEARRDAKLNHTGSSRVKTMCTNLYIVDSETKLEDDTKLMTQISTVISDLPPVLRDVKCTMMCGETFAGYVPNGLFRCGAVKAEVSTYPRQPGGGEDQMTLATKVKLQGTGRGQEVFDATQKLYRKIRAQKLNKGDIIELWPMQNPS